MPNTTYTISQLAEEFGVTTRTIRFYEEKGLVHPRREGQKRLYSPADRVRIKLILRGKRIGMSLEESVEVIDMYDPEHNNREQLQSLVCTVEDKRARLLQQKKDIEDMLAGLDEVQALCEQNLAEQGLVEKSLAEKSRAEKSVAERVRKQS
ncbi:MerR family transcriptional regulator [Kineobactrum sediminis]|uniref:MerR family transcriptional regulator n=1 Tax=Kineobactrum sediminis TaxID=1905677 RepID=A0A2N5XXZ2_9GAMM|nr:MerR family DNA-binding transcriptional regulator [Kineobactrum sediminis]PLW81017.1 MerR family transcriptional regulator [Kineobactrum sediminis]